MAKLCSPRNKQTQQTWNFYLNSNHNFITILFFPPNRAALISYALIPKLQPWTFILLSHANVYLYLTVDTHISGIWIDWILNTSLFVLSPLFKHSERLSHTNAQRLDTIILCISIQACGWIFYYYPSPSVALWLNSFISLWRAGQLLLIVFPF